MNVLFADTAASQQNSIVYAFVNSDIVGQSICFILLIFSVFTWVVMIEKGKALRRATQGNDMFVREFRDHRNPLAIRSDRYPGFVPLAAVYYAVRNKIQKFHIEVKPGMPRRALSDPELQIIHSTMEQAVEEQLSELDKYMIFLATAISACPFLGLFGTVWGITIAFTELAQKGKADIQTLAPGVSGALLTTVIALIVAIPSLVGYNILTSNIKKMTVRLDNFTEELGSRLKIEQMDSMQQDDGSGR